MIINNKVLHHQQKQAQSVLHKKIIKDKQRRTDILIMNVSLNNKIITCPRSVASHVKYHHQYMCGLYARH